MMRSRVRYTLHRKTKNRRRSINILCRIVNNFFGNFELDHLFRVKKLRSKLLIKTNLFESKENRLIFNRKI